MLRPHLRKKNESEKLQPTRPKGRPSSKKRRRRNGISGSKKMVVSFCCVVLTFLFISLYRKYLGWSLSIFDEFNPFHVNQNSKVRDTQKKQMERMDVTMEFVDSRDTCTSPEANVPWILNGECMKEPILSVLNNGENQNSCGLCGHRAFYLKNLRNGLEAKHKNQCKDLVVYGACLGRVCKKMLQKKTGWKFVQRPGTCFFMFVAGFNRSTMSSSYSKLNNLIFVDLGEMPYKNNRRNIKVLKFNPGLLFPWADRVIWQDAKLPSKWAFQLPKDYMLHFNRTAQNNDACVSFMGLPLNKASVGSSGKVTLRAQCDSVIAAAEERPSVSDSIDSVRTQCENYMKKKVSQTPLVDTAFIVYDMRSPVCRKFNGDFLCSWLDEIHCQSDRDQITFPFIMDAFNLKLASEMDVAGLEFRDQIYVNENKDTRIHIAKRSCHWYYSSFSRCVAQATQINESYEVYQNDFVTPSFKKNIRLAIIMAGTLQRFMFNSTLEHVFKPRNKQGGLPVDIDYFVSLTTQKVKAYRSDSAYTNYLESDPILPRSKFSDYVDLEEYIRDKVGRLGVMVGDVKFQENIDINSEDLLKARRADALRKYPNEDPDVKFPIFDMRSKEKAYHTANANRNLLSMHLSIQNLWNQAVKWEQEEGFKYDYVMFMRDDSLWLDAFDIHKLHAKNGDIFIPSCNARDPPMTSSEFNDHILISRRNVADLFGNYYKTLHSINVTKCMERLPETLTKKDKHGYKRGCNREMLLKHVTEENDINVVQIPQSEIPFQRSANVKIPDNPNIQCFHKFCQSSEFPMNTRNMKKCADIDWILPPEKLEENDLAL